jgi:activator of 2-hydroxyglutaryl-CoA dehydratase
MKAHLIFILIGMFLITTSCEDDDQEHDEEHTDADGFVLEDENGSEVYREFEGAIEGSVSLSVGDTLELSVHFLNHDGNEIEHEEDEEHEEEDELVVSENDVNIAIVEVEEHEEGEEGEHHEMAIHVIGVSAGSTSFKLQLMHDNHADYTSTNSVPIVVN